MTKATVDVVGKQIFINGQEVEVTPDSMFVTGIDELDKPLVVHVALVVEDLTIRRKAEPVETPEDAVTDEIMETSTATPDLVE